MRRRALLAVSAIAGSNGGELPTIPDGFFPLYLTHDSRDEVRYEYIYNPSDTTRELFNIVYGYATILGEYDGWAYDFYPEDYGIKVYLDEILITKFYVYKDGHAEIFSDNPYGEGSLIIDGNLWFYIY